MSAGFVPIFIDETGINFDIQCKKAWIIRGERFHDRSEEKQKNTTVLTAVARTQMIGWMFIDGGAIWEVFFFFLRWVLSEAQWEFPNKKIVLVFDNATVHHSMKIRDNLLDETCHVFTAPYSP